MYTDVHGFHGAEPFILSVSIRVNPWQSVFLWELELLSVLW